jgi:GR25 family glycosyltransferase involved in LPS biosynthesis
MIVKNEASIIVKTLNNLAQHINFDYWVISDTGSTDGTQQIIKDYFLEKCIPGELFTHEWRDFGYNRTKALEAAYDKTDFLLIFDADDQLNGTFKLPFTANPAEKYADRYMLKIGKGFEYVRPLLINNHKRWSFKGVLHEFLQNMEPVNEDITLGGDYHVESGRTGNRSQNPTKYYDDAIILENAYKTELALPDKGLSGRYAFYCARSYKDAGDKYHDKAIEWYKLLLGIENHWHQEKYYSALEIGTIYKQKNQMEEAVKYLLKTLEYDIERIEGLIMAIEYFYQTEQFILINALYHKFKNYKHKLEGKLFINMHFYQDRLEFFNAISAHKINDKPSGYECCKRLLINRVVGVNEINVTINNVMCCYKDLLEKDKNTLAFFHDLDAILCKNNDVANNKNAIDLWNALFAQNREQLTTINRHVMKTIQQKLMQPQSQSQQQQQRHPEKIIITFTTCKRLDLFKETIHSILNQWTDVTLITHWFCVDDNSSKEDRKYMKTTYPWIEYYMKTADEKGHRKSMNIIWDKLQATKPKYWIHMEDDFLFYHPMDYVKQSMDVLANNKENIKQIVLNRNYAETIEHYRLIGHLPLAGQPNIVMHDHRPNETITHYPNSQYWPHYSFRPSMVLVKAILDLGNFDSANQFFERDYADRWNDANYKTAFFNRITHRHIGRLTSEINTGNVKNAYELNAESQFTAVAKAAVPKNIRIVNLERRMDRKNVVAKLFRQSGLHDFSFFKAVDGKTLESTNELKKLFKGNDFGSRKGVLGCALSHYKLWQELLDDTHNTYYVIFEDDVTFATNKFSERFKELKPEFEKQEVLFLGYSMFSSNRNQEEIKATYDTLAEDTQIKSAPLNKKLYMGGTFAYSINKTGAKTLMDYIATNGIKHGIDYLMKIAPGLNSFEVQPFLAFSECYEHKDKPIDTDIQLNYDSLDFNNTIEDRFEFVAKLDQIGNDLYYKPGPLLECMSKALKDDKCAGFNTLGFFKNQIEKEKLTTSAYFKETDGVYIKKSALPQQPIAVEAKKMRLKMLCNWCSSEQLCKEWANMYDGSATNVEMTFSDDPAQIDYYVIINQPRKGESKSDYYDPKRTIVLQMEPWVADETKNWGVKTWGEWATPDPEKFFKVFTHKTHLNTVQWQMDYPFATQPVPTGFSKQNRVATICSTKNFDEGHILRNTFIHYVETLSPTTVFDVWGKENYQVFRTSYKGPVPEENKYNVYANYKYCFAAENNAEHNYATEKIWECILCESLCFYWGCPNLEEYLDPQAFVRLPLDDPAAAFKIIQQAIAEDWWTQRIAVIKQMKERILTKLGFFPMMDALLKA